MDNSIDCILLPALVNYDRKKIYIDRSVQLNSWLVPQTARVPTNGIERSFVQFRQPTVNGSTPLIQKTGGHSRNWESRDRIKKIILFVNYKRSLEDKVFAPGRPFKTSLRFMGKAWSRP